MAKKRFQKIRGTYDILPSDFKYWQYLKDVVENLCVRSGFSPISTPILEDAALFIKGTGASTDIVSKEMYVFTDKGGDEVALRPEETPGVIRAYIEHGMQNLTKPLKVYYFEPVFRYDRPQQGRYRQFWQFGYEVIGELDPVIDAEVILLTYRIYEKLGLTDLGLQINNVGCPKCRPKYVNQLKNYYSPRIEKICENCKRRLVENPLRLLDCKEEECQKLLKNVPQIVDFLCKECHEHFKLVLEYLDELDIPYNLNPYLVRGLDYYTKTAFEIWGAKEGAQNALGGGGRYDELVELYGGKPTPAIGFSGGMERIILNLKEKKIKIKEEKPNQVFIVQLGEKAKRRSLKLIDELRLSGIGAEADLTKDNIKSQLKLADKRGISTTLILGQKEIMDNTVIIKDMISGVQEVVDRKDIIFELKKRLPS